MGDAYPSMASLVAALREHIDLAHDGSSTAPSAAR